MQEHEFINSQMEQLETNSTEETTETEATGTTETESKTTETETTSNQTEESKPENDLASKLDGFEEEKPEEGDKPGLLGIVNDMGMLRNGLPMEFKSEEEIREHLSKGFDYTQKTQEHAESVKANEAVFNEKQADFDKKVSEFKEYEGQVQSKLVENNVLFDILREIQHDEPELIDQIERSYDSRMNSYNQSINNPAVNELKERYSELEKKIQGRDDQAIEKENGNIVKQWEDGLGEIQQAWGSKLKTLGIKPSWNKVQESWKNDSSNTMTVKQAFLAIHGEDINKAMESRNSLAETKAKSNLRKGEPVEQVEEKGAPKIESDLDVVSRIASKLGISA